MRVNCFRIGLLAIALTACATVVPPEASEPVAIGEKATVLEGERYLEYRIGVNISASPDVIWAILTNGPAFPEWNSTVLKIDGTIAKGEKIKLTSTVAPDREFPLTVSTFDPGQKLVWEDGGKAFKGVRTFTITDNGDGTTDVTMAEVLTGIFLPAAQKKLPDFRPSFDAFAAGLKKKAEADAPPAQEPADEPDDEADAEPAAEAG